MNKNIELGIERAREFGRNWALKKQLDPGSWFSRRTELSQWLRSAFVQERALQGLPGFSHETRQILKRSAIGAVNDLFEDQIRAEFIKEKEQETKDPSLITDMTRARGF